MAGRFLMLQKKVRELESELNDVVRLPLDPAAVEQTPFDDIKERIEFLEKIRAAEAVDSLQPDELRDIDERLARLKAAFSDWNQSRNCGFDNNDDDDDGGGDTQSLCSDCTQSQSKGLLHESSSRTREVEDFSGEKSSEKDRKEAAAAAEEEEAAGRRWSEIGKYGGAFGSGMIVGALCMLFKLSFSEYLFREEAFLMPPT